VKIIDVGARDIRFPTSRQKDGSDALNFGDYSATYVTLKTDEGLEGTASPSPTGAATSFASPRSTP
jgi:L-fuconate dehydratase